jgi:hypothetical protein
MSGLPPGQFGDYLIIGMLTAVVGGLILHFFTKEKGPRSGLIRIAGVIIVVGLVLLAGKRLIAPAASRPERTDPTQGSNDKVPSTPSDGSPHRESPEKKQGAIVSDTMPSVSTNADPVSSFIRDNVASPARSPHKVNQWAVVIAVPDKHEDFPELVNGASSTIMASGYSTVAIFRPAVMHNPGFDTLFAADPVLVRKLAAYCDYLLIGKVTPSMAENPNFPGLLTMTLTVDVEIISTRTGNIEHQFQVSEFGAGQKPEEARTNAENNVIVNLRARLRDAMN